MPQTPTIGRIVHYTLSEGDAEQINRRRPDGPRGSDGNGAIVHVGNHAAEGQVYPAVVVRVFDPSASYVNLQVLLDGNDTYWATSRTNGESGEAGRWVWPPRV